MTSNLEIVLPGCCCCVGESTRFPSIVSSMFSVSWEVIWGPAGRKDGSLAAAQSRGRPDSFSGFAFRLLAQLFLLVVTECSRIGWWPFA